MVTASVTCKSAAINGDAAVVDGAAAAAAAAKKISKHRDLVLAANPDNRFAPFAVEERPGGASSGPPTAAYLAHIANISPLDGTIPPVLPATAEDPFSSSSSSSTTTSSMQSAAATVGA